MTFQENTPRKTDLLAPASQRGAELVVKGPDEEASQEHAQSVDDHEPHRLQRLHVPHVLVVLSLLRRDGQTLPLALQAVLLARLAPFRAERHFHRVHAAQDDNGGQERVRVLVEDRVPEVVVIQGDEDRETGQEDCKKDPDPGRSRVREGCVAHQTRRVDHGELIHQLHGI